jgi:hypothetical protein
VRYWEWHDTRWGVVLEVVVDDDDRLERDGNPDDVETVRG